MARGKGHGGDADRARAVRDLRRELRRTEDDLETARRKRDRAQARLEALEAIAAQLTQSLEAAKSAAGIPDDEGEDEPEVAPDPAAVPSPSKRVRRVAPASPPTGRRVRTRAQAAPPSSPDPAAHAGRSKAAPKAGKPAMSGRPAKAGKPARPGRSAKPGSAPGDTASRRRRTRRAGGEPPTA